MDPGKPLPGTKKMITEFHDAFGIDIPEWLHV